MIRQWCNRQRQATREPFRQIRTRAIEHAALLAPKLDRAALDLLLSLEEEFEVSIPDQAFGDARTVSSLASLIGELR